MKFKFILILFFNIIFLNLYSYNYDLSICAIFRDEAPYLKEWIEFHKLVGVQHFYLYNHYSEDNFKQILQPYIDNEEVTLIDWNSEHINNAQKKAYNHALCLTENISKWVAFLDVDEYLFTNIEEDLVTFLRAFEIDKKVAGVVVNWQIFGTSGVKKLDESQLMIEQLTMKAKSNHYKNSFYKSIVRPEFIKQAHGPHRFSPMKPFLIVDSDGNTFNTDKQHKKINIEKIRINHYTLRDENFAYSIKLQRLMWFWDFTEEQAKFHIDKMIKIYNYEQDYRIHRYIDELNVIIFD